MLVSSQALRAQHRNHQRKKDKLYAIETKLGVSSARASFYQEQFNKKLTDKCFTKVLPPRAAPITLEIKQTPEKLEQAKTNPIPSIEWFHFLKDSGHSRIISIWFFLLMLLLVLNNDAKMVEAATATNRNFGRKNKPDKKKDTQPPTKKVPAKKHSNKHLSVAAEIQQFSALFNRSRVVPQTINLAAVNPFKDTVTTCTAITPERILPFCTGATTPENLRKVAIAITEVRAIDPIIAEYVDIVFTYLPDFQIALVTRQEVIEMAKKMGSSQASAGAYVPGERKLYLSYNTELQDYQRSLIIHEFRHAVMHTIQIARSQSLAASTENHYPAYSNEAAAEAMRYMAKGNAKIRQLHELLKAERSGKLSQKDVKYLARLRSLVDTPHARFYAQEVEIDTNAETIEHYFSLGRTVDDPEIYNYGPIKVLSHEQVGTDRYRVIAQLLDPLWALVNLHEKAVIKHVAEYPPQSQNREMDAHIFQRVPVPLLKEFYPEYLAYTRKLVTTTPFPERVRGDAMPSHRFLYWHDYQAQALLLRSEKHFEPESATDIVWILEVYLDNKCNLELCEKGAQALLKHGIKVGEAHAALGDLNHLRGNHLKTCDHYKMALKKKTIMRSDQLLQYATSLLTLKNYHEAADICRKTLKNSGEGLGWTKKEFEKIAAVAQKGLTASQNPTAKI